MSNIKATFNAACAKGEGGFFPAPPPTTHHPKPTASTLQQTSPAAIPPASQPNLQHSSSSAAFHAGADAEVLVTLANGDILVDPASGDNQAYVGAPPGRTAEDKGSKGKGKAGGGGRKRKVSTEGEDVKPARKKWGGQPKGLTYPSAGFVLPPPLDPLPIPTEKLDQLTIQFKTPFTTALPAVGDIFPDRKALRAAVDCSQRLRGHLVRCQGNYSPSRGDLLVFGCVYANASTKLSQADKTVYTACPVAVRCQPAPKLDAEGHPTGQVQGSQEEFQIIDITTWQHSHAPLDALKEVEYAPPTGGFVWEAPQTRGAEQIFNGAAPVKRTRNKKLQPPQSIEADSDVKAEESAPVKPKYGRGKTIPDRLPLPEPAEDESSGDDLLEQLQQIIDQAPDRLAPAATLGAVTPPAPLSPATASSGSPQRSEYDFNAPDAADPDNLFDHFGPPIYPLRPPQPAYTPQQLAQMVTSPTTGAASSDASTTAPFNFDGPVPSLDCTSGSLVTSPESIDPMTGLLGGAGFNFGALELPVVPLPLAPAPMTTGLPPASAMYDFSGATGAALPSPAAARAPAARWDKKRALDLDDLRRVLDELEPSLVSCAEVLGSQLGQRWSMAGRAGTFLNELEPGEVETLAVPVFTNRDGCGVFKARLLARAIGRKREAGLVWAGVEGGWVAEE